MLVVTRRKDETIDIITPEGIKITIMVVSVIDGRCRIGIAAPPEVEIKRDDMIHRRP